MTGGSFTKIWNDTVDLLVKGTAHTRMKVIGGKTTVKTSATSDIGRLTKSLKVAGTPIFAFFYYLISSYQVTKTISTLYCIFIIIVGVLRKSFINIRSTAY